MNLAQTQKGVSTVKDAAETSLYTIFSQNRWLISFMNSPFYFILMPLLAITISINAIFEWIKLSEAHNKNFQKIFGAVTTTLSAIAALTSIVGGIVAMSLGASFAAGPWLFVTSLAIGTVQQMVMLGINIYGAIHANPNSNQRKAFLQSAAHNLFNLALIALITALVIVVMISPAAPIAIAIVSAMAAAATLANVIWKTLTDFKPQWVHVIKSTLGLSKQLENTTEEHLSTQISKKIAEQERLLQSTFATKTADKMAVLKQLQIVVTQSKATDSPNLPAKQVFLSKYPRAFQSFFKEVGEVEALYDAVAANTPTTSRVNK